MMNGDTKMEINMSNTLPVTNRDCNNYRPHNRSCGKKSKLRCLTILSMMAGIAPVPVFYYTSIDESPNSVLRYPKQIVDTPVASNLTTIDSSRFAVSSAPATTNLFSSTLVPLINNQTSQLQSSNLFSPLSADLGKLEQLLRHHSGNKVKGYCTGMSRWFMSQFKSNGRQGLEKARELISKITINNFSDYSAFNSIIDLKVSGVDGEFCYLDSVNKTTQDLQTKLDDFPSNTPFYVYPNDNHVFVGFKLDDGVIVYDHASKELSEKIMSPSELIEKWLNFYKNDNNPFVFATNSSSLSFSRPSELIPFTLAQMSIKFLSKSSKAEIVNQMKKFRGNINHIRQDGATPLMLAVGHDHIELAKDILAKTTDVDHTDAHGSTALMMAIDHGHIELAKDILAKTTDVDHARSEGITALMIAVEHGYSELVKDILAKTTDVDHTDAYGSTALMMAIDHDHSELAKDILVKTTYVDHARSDGTTALMIAVDHGCSELAKDILVKTTYVDHAGSDGSTALMMAISVGQIELAKDILAKTKDVDHTRSDGTTDLMMAIGHGHIELAKDILVKTKDIDHARSDGTTALMMAIDHDHIELAKDILAKTKDVDRTQSDGTTALMILVGHDHSELAKDILAKTKDVDHVRSDGNTALMLAIDHDHIELAKDILAKTKDINHARSDGSTALMLAIDHDHSELAKDILAKTKDVDHSRSDGSTALMIAIPRGYSDLAKDILAKTKDVNHARYDGATNLMMAISNKHETIASLLYKKGANPYKRDKKGMKPSDWPLMNKIISSS
tara:strand:- start:411 stop:2777 length:2367 start_codon:yes stop_codon:yes gene_type:complete